MKKTQLFLPLLIVLMFSGCRHVDLRTKSVKETGLQEEQVAKGKALLKAAWQAQGMDKLQEFSTYEVKAEDHWKGMLGKFGKPWPDSRSQMHFKYGINSFDSQVKFLAGKREGVTAGLQSWQYYEQGPDGELAFLEKGNKKITFALSAFHYFFEMSDRLLRAPIIVAAGEKQFDGKTFDLVFVTWNQAEAHAEHDQYMLWINRETGMLEYAEYTLRENYLKAPGWKAIYGSIHYSDFRDVNGIKIPFVQHVFLNKPKADKKYMHRLTVSEFTFDSFDLVELYPNDEIPLVGDAKVK